MNPVQKNLRFMRSFGVVSWRALGRLLPLRRLAAGGLPNFGGLGLGCISADFCNQIVILQHFSRSTRFAHLCTFGIQSENHEKSFRQASSGRSTRPRRRNQQTAAMQRGLGEIENRRCTRHSALTGRGGTALIQKTKSWNAGHSALVVQRELCSANAIKNCNDSEDQLFNMIKSCDAE